MNKKQGTERQRRATEFSKNPATGTSLCPFKGPDIAIVPMRYALDRSRYDPNPHALTPLCKTGKWPWLPTLQSRTYTLRQLYDGYVYVFDETAGTLHEYAFSATDAGLRRIVWTEAHLGQDERTGDGEALPYLLYPRNHTLHIAYAPMQWTWRICEHLRSHDDSRALWMKRLDLASYCITMNEPGTLPLTEIARAVAEVDTGCINEDQRFADTALPTTQPPPDPEKPDQKPEWVPLGADVHWLGSVPDKDSALLIALDDPLAILKDLGMQLAGDQAAYQSWQAEHGHKVEMATTVTGLCGQSIETEDKLPFPFKDNPVLTQQYLLDAESYLEQCELEHHLHSPVAIAPDTLPSIEIKSDAMHQSLLDRYGRAPNQADKQAWKERKKWRREIDLKAARGHLQRQYLTSQRLLQRVRDTQADLQQWSERIGLEPEQLFIDTGNPNTLLHLQMIMVGLTTVLSQDNKALDWLMQQEKNATTLFGTMRYGFSLALKEALHHEADTLIGGFGDIANIATRAGELNSALNHEGFAEAAWMKALKQPVQDTFKALRSLASSTLEDARLTAQNMLIAWLPVDSRLAHGPEQNLGALLRNLLIGQIFSNSPIPLAVDNEFARKLSEWKSERLRLSRNLNTVQMRWFYPREPWIRQSLTRDVQARTDRLKAHDQKLPMLLDFQNNRYAALFRQEIERFFQAGKDIGKHWQQQVRNWSQRLSIGASISWGVIMLNFINTALTYEQVSRDGDLSAKDLVKVAYNLGYSFNLLMALYVEAPWGIIKNAQPLQRGKYSIGILDRSSSYWKAQGRAVWGDAVRSFKIRLLATGGFAIGAVLLEAWDLHDDYENAATQNEKTVTAIKGLAVGIMGIGGTAQIIAVTTASRGVAAFVMGPWFAVGMLAAGMTYLAATLLLNYLKQDNIGSWLRKCSWSRSPEYRFPETPEGQQEEKRALLEIQLSPQVMVKSTVIYRHVQIGKSYTPRAVQNGAWIQIRFPHALRGQSILFNAIASKRTLPLVPTQKIESSVKEEFEDKGLYHPVSDWGKIDNQRPPVGFYPYACPAIPETEDIIWKVWVPLDQNAQFLEFQIWYPLDLLHASPQDSGYLYQIELSEEGKSTLDGLSKTELPVKNKNREGAVQLFMIP
ncbi:hypothetical protein PS3A_41690 [Pseudomonas sp. 3A(2025)]